MANEKVFQSRIQLKHDTEENWLKATNFIPKEGEIVIYDVDENNPIARFKIGDGTTKVNQLSFVSHHKIISYLPQVLSEEEKAQARENISAASVDYVDSKTIHITLDETDGVYSLPSEWTYTDIKDKIYQDITVILEFNSDSNHYYCQYAYTDSDDSMYFCADFGAAKRKVVKLLNDNTVHVYEGISKLDIQVVSSTSNYKLTKYTYDELVDFIASGLEVSLYIKYNTGAIHTYTCAGLVKYSNYDYVVPEFTLHYNNTSVVRLVVHPESEYPDGNVIRVGNTLVMTNRTINGHALSANVKLTAEDVGAISAPSITWDGDTTDRETFTYNGQSYYKVSNVLLTSEDLIGGIATRYVISTEATNSVEIQTVRQDINGGDAFACSYTISGKAGKYTIPLSEETNKSCTIPSDGTYFCKTSTFYATSLQCRGIPLDIQYIPVNEVFQNIPGVETASVGDVMQVSAIDENGTPTAWEAASHTSVEVVRW